MSTLRQQMIEAMCQRGFSKRTHKSYLEVVRSFALYFNQSPDKIQARQLQDYFDYLVQQRGLGGNSCRLHLHGLRFFYLHVLNRPEFDIPIVFPKKKERIPELLTRTEVQQIIEACPNDKHRVMLLTCYGCGLRVSELVQIKIQHIDGERQLLRIEQGKGSKDRMVVISPSLLQRLREYWHSHHPKYWLFPNANTPKLHLSVTTIQKQFRRAKQATGITKAGGIHALRHAYATHQLENGIAITQLKQQLGHKNL
ncbi:MAG: site-specific integrase, partial [Gammaproteobacteria bacterium]|nr:site-specific integrase [Gammaproteobacteria bacterium]